MDRMICVSHSLAGEDTDISPEKRDEAVRWLRDVHSQLKLYPETLCLAINILDRFLFTIKAHPKYLRCIAISCFFLAVKTSEEDERIPSLRELASSSRCGCSPSEILRMERIVLDKLNWDLHSTSALDFLYIFHAMVLSCKSGLNPSQHVALLTQQLFHCLAQTAMLQVRGSVLSLTLITLELEKLCTDWLALTVDLLHKAQMDSSQLIGCRELVACCLSTHMASLPPNTVYICHSLLPHDGGTLPGWQDSFVPTASGCDPHRPSNPNTAHTHSCPKLRLHCKSSAKRKVEHMEVDEYFDGIKRLYNEESPQEGALQGSGETVGGGPGLSCGLPVVRQNAGSSPCPPLQPVRET
ncbi:cyclin-I-like isoform X2 [Myxocyprinus asiaticus]|uniref:cyclin-I-like isoform X2 n=1 Tax=Myxocyprinus asiaticus TaxID=70543 RepID=UPI00222325DB|nr:cyclin-I-like isoform X2 [Myxocyprinus asiaticus]